MSRSGNFGQQLKKTNRTVAYEDSSSTLLMKNTRRKQSAR